MKRLGYMRLIPLLLFLCFAWPGTIFSQGFVTLNEVLAQNDNKNNLANEVNEFGNASDWVEIINASLVNANLQGMRLVKGDNPATTNTSSRFIFTNSVPLRPGEILRVWCDKDGTNAAGVVDIHTGFSLDKDADTVLLVDADGSVRDLNQLSFGPQLSDYSIARSPDGEGDWMLGIPTPNATNLAAVLGDPMVLRINEWCPTNWGQWLAIIQHPNDTNAGDCGHCKADWVELYNPSPFPIALALGTDQALSLRTEPPPSNLSNFWTYSFIEGYGFLRYWADKNKKNEYDPDELNFNLSHNTGETLILRHYNGTQIDSITFPGQPTLKWVVTNGPPGTQTNFTWYAHGRLPDGDTNIVQFPVVLTNGAILIDKTTPGESNFLPLTNNVYINELLAHTDPPLQDAVEFVNTGTNAADLSYYWFSNNRNNPKKYQFPAGFIIPAGGYRVIYEYMFNTNFSDVSPQFSLNSAVGDDAYIFSATSNGTLTGYRRGLDFGSSANGVSFGRYTNSQGNMDFVAMSQLTLGSSITSTSAATPANSNAFVSGTGAANPYPLVGPIVISEIMYHPPDVLQGTNIVDNSLDEYVELFNPTSSNVYLYDTEGAPNAYTNRWRMHRTIEYTFPTNTALSPALVLPPGRFLLLVNFAPWESSNTLQLAHFRQIYNLPTTFTNLWGPYTGKLSNKGGTLELYRPDYRQTHGIYVDYVPQILVEKIEYDDKSPWPTNADGFGSALQRMYPQGYGNDPTNWVAAIPTPGSHAAHIDSVVCSNNVVTVSFSGWPNASYNLLRSSVLVSNFSSVSWTVVTNVPSQPAFGTRQASDAVVPGQSRFYRVATPVP
jgi:hypothetical protein